MATTPKGTIYPFAEMFEVETDGTTAVDFWKIPKGTIITMVVLKIKTAGTGSCDVIVGDDDDDNGYILSCDCTASADTVYGDAVGERGVYIEEAADGTKAGAWKVYTAYGKELKIDCAAAPTTEATLEIMVFGYRYSES